MEWTEESRPITTWRGRPTGDFLRVWTALEGRYDFYQDPRNKRKFVVSRDDRVAGVTTSIRDAKEFAEELRAEELAE